MRSRRLDKFSRYSLAWLMGLMLLLPVAQTAASWHLLSHVGARQSEPTNVDRAVHEHACDLCLTALALTGGAIAGRFVSSAPIMAPSQTPAVWHSAVGLARTQRPYESRAPPSIRY